MPTWIKTAALIVTGHAAPRDLPATGRPLAEAMGLYALVSMVDAALILGPARAVGFGCADLLFTLSMTALALTVRRRGHRLPQTLMAMLGTGMLLTLPSIAVNWGMSLSGWSHPSARLPLPAELILTAVLCWSIVTVARIMRDALDVDFFTGLTVAMTYFLADYLLLVALPAQWGL